MTCEFAHFDGAYVLGALSPADRLAFERHLATCAVCTQAVRQLAGMPGLLGRVPAETLALAGEAEPLPETLLPTLVRRAQESQRRRTRLVVAVAAVAAIIVSAGTATVVVLVDDSPAATEVTPAPSEPAPSEPAQTMTPLGDLPVAASLSATGVDWGTRLELTCTYDAWGEADPTGPAYVLVIRTVGGQVEQVATWRALPGREMTLDAATATGRDDIASAEVRTADGRPVLRLKL